MLNTGHSRWVDDPRGTKCQVSSQLSLFALQGSTLWPLSTAYAKLKKFIIFYVSSSWIFYCLSGYNYSKTPSLYPIKQFNSLTSVCEPCGPSGQSLFLFLYEATTVYMYELFPPPAPPPPHSLPPALDRILVHLWIPSVLNLSPLPIWKPGWREAMWEQSVLPHNTTQCPRPGARPGLLNDHEATKPPQGLREGEMGEKYLWSNTVAALYKLDNHHNFVVNCEFEIYFFRFNNLLYVINNIWIITGNSTSVLERDVSDSSTIFGVSLSQCTHVQPFDYQNTYSVPGRNGKRTEYQKVNNWA